jgi:hypothetical protein
MTCSCPGALFFAIEVSGDPAVQLDISRRWSAYSLRKFALGTR